MARPSDETILSIDRRAPRRGGGPGGRHRPEPRRDLSRAARPVRRGRHDPGTARARQRSLRRRRRARVGRRDGQRRDEGRVRRGRACRSVRIASCCGTTGSSARDASTAELERRSATRCSSSRRTWDRASASRRRRRAPGLIEAMDLAGAFDRKIVIEAAVPDAREIECAVLGNDAPEASVPGEIVPSREFYDYEAKYLDDGSKIIIPADICPRTAAEIQRLSIAAFKAIDCAGMARVDFLLEPRHDLRQRGEHDSRLHHDQHVREALGRLGRRLPGAAGSARRARARAPRRKAAAPHQPDMKHAAVAGRRCSCRWPCCSAQRQRRGARSARGRSAASTASRAPTMSSSTRGSTRSTRSCAAPAGRRRPKPATCSTRHRALVADPARSREPRARRRVFDRGRPRDRTAPKPGPSARPTTPKPGSTPAAPTPPACSGACCATRSSPPRATARASSRRSSAPSRSIPTLDDAYFGIGMYKYYADVAPAGREGAAFPAAAARRRPQGRARADAARAQPRPAAAGGGRLPAAHHLSLVRAADPARACSCSSRCTSGTRPIRSSSRRSPRSRTATSTTSPPASRRGGAAGRGARAARQRAGAERGAGAARHRAAARGAAPDRRCDRNAAGGDRAAAVRPVRVAAARLPAAGRGLRPPGARAPAHRRVSRRGCAPRCRRDPHDVRAQTAEHLRRAPDPEARRSVPPVARGLAAPRAQRSAGAPPALAVARSRSTDPIRSRATASAACSRRGRTTRARSRSSSTRSAAPAPARRRFSATPTSKPRACSSGSVAAPRRSPTTAPPTTLFGAAPTRAPPPRARSRASTR